HVVEPHRLAVGTVHARLGIGEPREDPRGPLAHARLEPAALEDLEDVAQRPVMMRLTVDLDVDLGRPEIPLHHLAHGQPPPPLRPRAEPGTLRLPEGTPRSCPPPPHSDSRNTQPSNHPHLTRAAERNLTDPGSERDLPLESLSSIAQAYIYACAQSAPRHPST